MNFFHLFFNNTINSRPQASLESRPDSPNVITMENIVLGKRDHETRDK
jgi:hypothetical protein